MKLLAATIAFPIIFHALCPMSHAATVVWPAVELSAGGHIIGTDLARPFAGGAGVFMDILTDGPVDLLASWMVTAAVGHFWYETDEGAPIDANAVSMAVPFAENFSPTYGTIELEIDRIFYLGFWLDADAGGAPSDIYGWASLVYDGTTLSLVDSAAETTGVGIYAGTHTPVPEPATGALALAGLVPLVLRRWHKWRATA
jgi:hypothetical protein